MRFFRHQAPIGTINFWFWIFGISGFSGRRATVAGKGGVPEQASIKHHTEIETDRQMTTRAPTKTNIQTRSVVA